MAKKGQQKLFIPPTLDEVKDFFLNNNTGFVYKESAAVQAFNYYNVANWHDSRGNPVINWKQKMFLWFTEQNRQLSPIKKADKKLINGVWIWT